MITSKDKINVFLNFFCHSTAYSKYAPLVTLGHSVRKNFQKTLILAFEANSAASLNCTFFLILAHFVIRICIDKYIFLIFIAVCTKKY